MDLNAWIVLLGNAGCMVICCALFFRISTRNDNRVDELIKEQAKTSTTLITETRNQNIQLHAIAEGIIPETLAKSKMIVHISFDLLKRETYDIVQIVRNENHIADKPNTFEKIHQHMIDLNDKQIIGLDGFTYKGRNLIDYIMKDWKHNATKIVCDEVYLDRNSAREKKNIEAFFDGVENEFIKTINAA